MIKVIQKAQDKGQSAIRFDGTNQSFKKFKIILTNMGFYSIKHSNSMEMEASYGQTVFIRKGMWLVFWQEDKERFGVTQLEYEWEWIDSDEEFHALYEQPKEVKPHDEIKKSIRAIKAYIIAEVLINRQGAWDMGRIHVMASSLSSELFKDTNAEETRDILDFLVGQQLIKQDAAGAYYAD